MENIFGNIAKCEQTLHKIQY